MPFFLPKNLPFVSQLFSEVRKVRRELADPLLFDLIVVALIIFAFGVGLCVVGGVAKGTVGGFGLCAGMILIVVDALMVGCVYVWRLLKGETTTLTEGRTVNGIRNAKAVHLVEKK
jgi:hypothetical protein